jgi:acyl-CoA thioesterase-1
MPIRHFRPLAALACFVLALLLCVPAFAAAEKTILVFGDSLSAGYGLASGQGWVNLLEQKLKSQGLPFRVTNASISGETTAGGKSRIDAALKQFSPNILILELGANDGLRGSSLAMMRDNLDYMIGEAKSRGAKVLLVGMRLPPNYGPAYTKQFQDSFGELAGKHRVALVPFLFEGLKDDEQSFQADRLHPSAQAQATLLANVWDALTPMMKGIK